MEDNFTTTEMIAGLTAILGLDEPVSNDYDPLTPSHFWVKAAREYGYPNDYDDMVGDGEYPLAGEGESFCDENDDSWFCTRGIGHDGPHAGHVIDHDGQPTDKVGHVFII